MARLLWTQKQDIGPSARSQFALAYDAVRKLTYLFGGSAGLGDTWAWDGRYWTQVTRLGPEKRTGAAMAFDAARRNTVLFGGETSPGQAARDTWAFDGAGWTQVEDLGPAPRSRHAVTYDEIRGRVVLFGGLHTNGGTTGVFDDTWEWDGISWTQVEDAGPPARCGHAMAYDNSRKRTVLFGGVIAGGPGGALQPSGDTWEWDGASWTQVADTGPAAREDAAMSAGATVVLHGGSSTEALGDSWQWAGGAWSKVQEFGPSRRRRHAMAVDADRKTIVLFGGEREPGNPAGQRPEFLGDTWEAPEVAAAPPDGGGVGPTVSNFTVTPVQFPVQGVGEGITVAFDIPPQLVQTPYEIYFESPPGNRVVVLSTPIIPAGVDHVAQNIDRPSVRRAITALQVAPPVTVAVSTSLGGGHPLDLV
jgi:hypothetical protein